MNQTRKFPALSSSHILDLVYVELSRNPKSNRGERLDSKTILRWNLLHRWKVQSRPCSNQALLPLSEKHIHMAGVGPGFGGRSGTAGTFRSIQGYPR